MHIEYTPEEVRALIEEYEVLDFTTATADDLAEATDVLEGVEELISKLDPATRREAIEPVGVPVADLVWIPVANNCTRSAGVAVSPEGILSFAVRGEGEGLASYFAARQAVTHALLGSSPRSVESISGNGEEDTADCSVIGQYPRLEVSEEDPLVTLLKENGWAVAAGRTLADVDDEVLVRAYRLSEEGIAYLFATEAGDGIVMAMAGSTAGDRQRAVEALPTLPGRGYSSRSYSVLCECGEAGDHYSEQEGFGQTVKEAPKPKKHLLEAAAERFKAARFVRPSSEKPLDIGAIRRHVRKVALVRAAVRSALAVDPTDAGEMIRRVVAAYLIARAMSRKMVHRALAAERPWDSKAEQGRMIQAGRRIRSEIVAGREARSGEPIVVRTAGELDAERRDRLAPLSGATEDPNLQPSTERRRKNGRAAYDTARAVYLQRCPELEHKLLHLLRRDGVQSEGDFLSRHDNLAAEATDPEGALRSALRRLAGAGKVRRVRSSKTGEVFLTATEPLDETGLRKCLNGLIRDERFGIVNPWTTSGSVESDGEAGEWEEGLQDLESHESDTLAPRRFRSTEATEQPLMAAEQVAEYSAFEEVEVVAESVQTEPSPKTSPEKPCSSYPERGAFRVPLFPSANKEQHDDYRDRRAKTGSHHPPDEG